MFDFDLNLYGRTYQGYHELYIDRSITENIPLPNKYKFLSMIYILSNTKPKSVKLVHNGGLVIASCRSEDIILMDHTPKSFEEYKRFCCYEEKTWFTDKIAENKKLYKVLLFGKNNYMNSRFVDTEAYFFNIGDILENCLELCIETPQEEKTEEIPIKCTVLLEYVDHMLHEDTVTNIDGVDKTLRYSHKTVGFSDDEIIKYIKRERQKECDNIYKRHEEYK